MEIFFHPSNIAVNLNDVEGYRCYAGALTEKIRAMLKYYLHYLIGEIIMNALTESLLRLIIPLNTKDNSIKRHRKHCISKS